MHVRGRAAARLLTDSHGCHTYGSVGTIGASRCKRQGGGEGCGVLQGGASVLGEICGSLERPPPRARSLNRRHAAGKAAGLEGSTHLLEEDGW